MFGAGGERSGFEGSLTYFNADAVRLTVSVGASADVLIVAVLLIFVHALLSVLDLEELALIQLFLALQIFFFFFL